MTLSRKQLDAARRLGQDVCVIAGPGSGKTRVLIERFAWLVTERGISPQRILAITFTEKAATEIKQRMAARFEDDLPMREQIERAYVSTVHAFCARLLRENAIAAAVDPQFEVIDWDVAHRLLRDVADEVLESIYENTPQRMRGFLRSLAVATERDGYVPDLAESLMEIYDAIRIAGVQISAARLETPHFDAEGFRCILAEIASERPRINTANQADQHAAIQSWAREFLALSGPARPDHFRLLNAKFNGSALVRNSVARNRLEEVRQLAGKLRSHLLIDFYSAERELILGSLQQIDRVFRERKRAISSLDFDDLEEFAIRLLETNAGLRARVQNQFDFILMDELQDTNPLQWKLLGLIRRENNFFAVGDVNQSIFGFRHAEPELFNGYRRRLETEGKQIDELRDNFRTVPSVLAAVNKVFDGAPGIEPHTLMPQRQGTGPVQTFCSQADTAEPAERTEAAWVAQRIGELVQTGAAHYRDIAVLVHANAATGVLQQALDDHGVPSIVLGGLTLFDTREIRDLMLLRTVLDNPRNEIALAGVLRSPLFGISDEELFRLTLDSSLADAVEKNPPPGWNLVTSLREMRNSISPDRLLRRIIDATDYESGLSSRARANIEKFLSGLRAGREPGAPDSEAPPADFGDAVRLMTIHKSKGLEFPIVFLPFLHSTRGTGFPIVSYSHKYGLGVKWRDPDTRAPAPDCVHELNRRHLEALQIDEDNRLLYVGMTRAKDAVVLSFSETKFTRGRWPELIKRALPIDQPPSGARVPAGIGSSESTSRFVERPPVAGQFDATASVTDVSVFAQCPRKYYLSRYLGFRKNSSSSTSIDIGSQTHALLANQPVADVHPEAIELAGRFRASRLGRQSERCTNKACEYELVFALDDLVLRGQIDLWFEHGRDLIIVDYKTDRHVDPAPYEIQLQLYALALERALKRTPTRACLHFLRSDELIEIDLSPLALNGARNVVLEFHAAQETLDFPINPGQHCHRCDHFGGLCPAPDCYNQVVPAALSSNG